MMDVALDRNGDEDANCGCDIGRQITCLPWRQSKAIVHHGI